MTRRAAVAGMFYEADRVALRESIEERFLSDLGPGKLPSIGESRIGKVVGLVCPHAGYVYSGSAAAHAYSALASDGIPDIAVLLGPNHTGLGSAVGISMDSEWATPLGSLRVDTETADAILANCRYVQRDEMSHIKEHSIEVQLPFLQYIAGDHVRIVPISIAHLSEPEALVLATELGGAIASALDGKSAVVIASTDFSHYESASSAHMKDSMAIEHILRLDAPGLIRTVYGKSITMCGVIGTSIMLEACKALGATTARKLAYYTSGDVTGDMTQVVGYGALCAER